MSETKFYVPGGTETYEMRSIPGSFCSPGCSNLNEFFMYIYVYGYMYTVLHDRYLSALAGTRPLGRACRTWRALTRNKD